MHIHLSAPKIWLASEPVDFRKAIDGLSELVATHTTSGLSDHLYIFYNKNRNKLKLLAYHRQGALLIYKRLDKKKFTLLSDDSALIELNEQQLSWLLAGLDWVSMSEDNGCRYNDYY